ncbi:hypothetical protein ACJW31_11G075700 [Castanea mollissima]
MKGGGKKRNNGGVVGSEPALASPNDAVAAANGGESLVADLGEKDQTQKAKDVGEQEKIQQLQQQQQVEPEAEAKATEEGAAAEEQEDEQDDDEEEDGDDDEDEAATERPKLDEGFYEIEAIRRKRVRKGQLQYLIKWRGWPEAANTWEPLENLQSCSDVIDAFEDSLRSGKHRKRKRKHGTPHTQSKKKQQRSTFPADVTGDRNGDIKEITKQTGVENGCGNVSQQNDNSKDGNEYDPKLSELKTIMSTNEASMDKLAIHFEEAKASEGDAPADGGPKTDCIEPAQSNRRIGAKRRKSSSVKRFKQDSGSREPVSQNATTRSGGSFGRVQQPFTGNPGFRGENSICRNGTDGYKDASNITRIIKPIGYSASVSNNIQDVLVTFTAMRSDGTEVMVDNKFLKANNPLLLINFYEQHLRYSPTSSLDRDIDGDEGI